MTIENKRPSYLEMAALGLARGAITFPLEHVLERMKLESQAHPKKNDTASRHNSLAVSRG